MKLFENGQSPWKIVVAKDANKLTRLAAEEIQEAVQACGGAQLPIVEMGEAPAIYLCGASGGMFDEDYTIEVSENQVRIAGSGLRGTLYGAYQFLEDQLGVRYFSPDTTHYPRRDSLILKNGKTSGKPDIALRRMPFKSVTTTRFGARARFNELTRIPGLAENPEYGRGDYQWALGHSIHHMVPDSLFETHPEYFPYFDGKRRHGEYHQRCLTNPEVLDLTVEAVRKQLRANPMQTTIAVGQADTYPDAPNNCCCEKCRAIDEAEGTPMGTLLRFVNAVAERIEPEFPHVMINTLAYRYTRKPPKITRPRDNVMIVLCSIECCFSHPIGSGCGANYVDGPIGNVGNDEFVADLEGWSAISKNLMIWDYVTNFPHYLAPHPNLHCIGPNVRFFRDHNAYGIYPEGAHDVLGAELDEARSYMFGKLLWDCDRDEKVDRDEFLIGKLGVAAAGVMRAIDMLEEHVRKENLHMSTYHTPDERVFPREMLDTIGQLLDRSEATAPTEEARLYVQKIRMSLRYVNICLYTEGTVEERKQIKEDFLKDMCRLGIEALMERGDMEKSSQRLDELLKLEAEK